MRSAASKEKHKLYNRKYRQTEAGKESAIKHLTSEHYKQLSKEYGKKYRKEHRSELNQYLKLYNRWYRKTKKGREISRLSSIARRSRMMSATGSHTFGEWENLKAQYDWKCPSCGKREPEIQLTADHIIPLSIGGSNNIENIQPLCRSCNSSKHTKIVKY